MTRADAIVAAARSWLGTRFRPQGRGRDGLDCVGLVAVATGRAAPCDYALRGGSADKIGAAMAAAGFSAIAPGTGDVGDVLLCAAGPWQWHLVVLTPGGFVHADAGLRRVVETPGRPRWATASAWRDPGD